MQKSIYLTIRNTLSLQKKDSETESNQATLTKRPRKANVSVHYPKGQGSRRVKIGPVSKIDEILLYCVCMSSVTENDLF